jgi:hypothetical protein
MQRVKATVRPKKEIRAKSAVLGIGGNISITQIKEIDTTNAQDGAVLLYDGNVNQFKSTTKINNPNTTILGGGF